MNSDEYNEAIVLLKSNAVFSHVVEDPNRKYIDLKSREICFRVDISILDKYILYLVFQCRIGLFSYDFVWRYAADVRRIGLQRDFVVNACVRFSSSVNIATDLFNELHVKGIRKITTITHVEYDETCRLFCNCSFEDGERYKYLYVEFTENEVTRVSTDGKCYVDIGSPSGASIASYFFDNGEWRKRDSLNSKALELCAKMDGILESVK